MGNKRGGKGGLPSWVIALSGFAAGVVAILLLLNYSGYFNPPEKEALKPVAKLLPPEAIVPKKPVEEAVKRPKAEYPMLAIVIDDMGQDLRKLDEIARMDAPITVAVIPSLIHSRATAAEAYSKGLEVILHLPMEPKDLADNNPGKGALLTAMTPAEVRAKTEAAFDSIPHADGVNNHMGSKFTENERLMAEVLRFVKSRNVFFLDSRTTPGSVAGRLAREMGVKNADRNVFLDNTRDTAYIKERIDEAARIARKRGRAIAIGHPYPETIEALKETVGGLNGKGVRVVRLSEVVR